MKLRINRALLTLAVLMSLLSTERRHAIADAPGLFAPSHTGSTITATEAGRSIGYAYLINPFPDGESSSKDAWYYDGTTNTQIGFLGVDGDFTIPHIYPTRYSEPSQLNAAGHAVGFSKTFVEYPDPVGIVETGQAAWFYDGDSIHQIGLLNSSTQVQFELQNVHYSKAEQLNTAGQVIGFSKTFAVYPAPVGVVGTGQDAWFYDGNSNSIQQIGLLNSLTQVQFELEFIHFSQSQELNNAGQVIGYSETYHVVDAPVGPYITGRQAWYFDGSTRRIGLGDRYGTETLFDGIVEYDQAQVISDSGLVIGYAKTFERGADGTAQQTGTISWLFDGTTTTDFPLDTYAGISIRHERINASGYKVLDVDGPNVDSSVLVHAGHVTDIGLHSEPLATQHHFTRYFNETGQVAGTVGNGSAIAPIEIAWFYDGVSTFRIGMYDDTHHPIAGRLYLSSPSALNNAGQVIGTTTRNGGKGQTGWIYEPALHETVPFVLSVRADGTARSEPQYFGEDGLVLGDYKLYDGSNDLGYRPFYYQYGDIPRDFGDFIGGDFNAHQWNDIDIEQVGGTRQFLLTSTDNLQHVFQYTVDFPEPIPGAGDYNGDGVVDTADYAAWGGAFGAHTYPGANADGNGNGQIDAADYVLWRWKLSQTTATNQLNGDYNNNGTVEAADYVAWRKGLGTTYTQNDYSVWRAHFGQTLMGSGSDTRAAVPEPPAICSAVLCAAILLAAVPPCRSVHSRS